MVSQAHFAFLMIVFGNMGQQFVLLFAQAHSHVPPIIHGARNGVCASLKQIVVFRVLLIKYDFLCSAL